MENIVELVTAFVAHAKDDPNLTIEDFCKRYLQAQTAQKTATLTNQSIVDVVEMVGDTEFILKNNRLNDDSPTPLNSALGSLTGRLSRFALLYTKKALAPLDLSSIDDMVYMHIINALGTPRKSDVIHEAISEFPSGIDIIKRLVKMGCVEELADDTDRRSKRLRLTEKGKTVLLQAYSLADKAGDAAFNYLNATEKQTLLELLRRLDAFHWQHYKQTRTAKTVDEIIDLLGVEGSLQSAVRSLQLADTSAQ
jgi:predicted transcriptional regulator